MHTMYCIVYCVVLRTAESTAVLLRACSEYCVALRVCAESTVCTECTVWYCVLQRVLLCYYAHAESTAVSYHMSHG